MGVLRTMKILARLYLCGKLDKWNVLQESKQNQLQEKLWNGNYKKVMGANFCLYFALYLITPLLPVYLSDTFNAPKDIIGIVLSGYTLTALLSRPFSGYLVDKFNRKKILLICLLIFCVLFCGYLLAGSLLVFTIIRTLHGAPFGASSVANSTVAIDVLPSSRRTEGIGFYGLSNNIATAISPTAGILLYKYTGSFDLLFWISFIVAALGLYSASRIDCEKYKKKTAAPKPTEVKEAALKEPAIKERRSIFDRFFLLNGWHLGINILMFGYCYGVLSSYLAIYGKERLGITGGTGTYFFILSLGLIMSRLQGRKALKKGKLVSNALEGIIISTIGYTLFIIYPHPVCYYTSALLIGLGNGHMWPAMQNMIINMAPNSRRGTANSTILTSWDLGMGLGILLGGIIAERISYDASFWSSVIAHVLGLTMFVLITKKLYAKNNLLANQKAD